MTYMEGQLPSLGARLKPGAHQTGSLILIPSNYNPISSVFKQLFELIILL